MFKQETFPLCTFFSWRQSSHVLNRGTICLLSALKFVIIFVGDCVSAGKKLGLKFHFLFCFTGFKLCLYPSPFSFEFLINRQYENDHSSHHLTESLWGCTLCGSSNYRWQSSPKWVEYTVFFICNKGDFMC